MILDGSWRSTKDERCASSRPSRVADYGPPRTNLCLLPETGADVFYLIADHDFAFLFVLQQNLNCETSFNCSGSRSSPQQSIMTKCVPSQHLGKVSKT